MLKKLLFKFSLFISLVSIGQTELPYEFFNNSDYADSEIYVGLVGRFGSDDVWMDMTTSSIELMSADLNTIPGPEWSTPEGWTYPDIFTPLSEIDNNTITIPHGLYGCRIFISFESPMYLRFHATGGYAGANLGLDLTLTTELDGSLLNFHGETQDYGQIPVELMLTNTQLQLK